MLERPVGWHSDDVVIGAGGLRLDFRSGQNGHSVANDSSLLRCFFGAMLPSGYAAEMSPATDYTVRRNNIARNNKF